MRTVEIITHRNRSLCRAVRQALRKQCPALCLGAGVLALGMTGGASAAHAGSFPPEIDLRTLHPAFGGDGSTGFVIKGIHSNDLSGKSVSSGGDLNSDGIDDLIIGAEHADAHGDSAAGESYVVFGRTSGFPAAFGLRDLTPALGGDGSEGFIVKGIDFGDASGSAVSSAGDVNADEIDDLVIGASAADPRGNDAAGESYLVFGRTTGFPAAFELRSLLPQLGGDGSDGVVLRGIESDDRSGDSVRGAGDLNGDGIADLIIGAYKADANGHYDAGESYVVFGRKTGFPAAFELARLAPAGGGDGSEGFMLKGIGLHDGAGTAVTGAGDLNGDGVDDLLIGAPGAGNSGKDNFGESYVVFGRTTGFPAAFELRSLHPAFGGNGGEGFVLTGINRFDASGGAVSGAGDVNGDGIDDVIVGASSADRDDRAHVGESYVVFGRMTGFPAEFELSGLDPAFGGDGSEGFILKGIDADDRAGRSVGGAGDVNGDGTDDLIIGASEADRNGQLDAGETYVVFGRVSGFPAVFELRSLTAAQGGDGSKGFILMGAQARDLVGRSVSGAGDVNGDGVDDVIIGAIYAYNRRFQAGVSYVVFGRSAVMP